MVEQGKTPNETDLSIALGHLRRWRELSGVTGFEETVKQFFKQGAALGWESFTTNERDSTLLYTLPQKGVVQNNGFVFNRDTRALIIPDGETVDFSPTEVDIFNILISHAGKVIQHSTIRQVFTRRGMNPEEADQSIRVHIHRLRNKIKDIPLSKKGRQGYPRWRYITTIPGKGYIFNPDGPVV